MLTLPRSLLHHVLVRARAVADSGFPWHRVEQVGAQYKTGEVAKSEWQMVQQSPPWAVDAWGLGCLMQEAFSGRTLTRTQELRNTESVPQAVLQVTLRTDGRAVGHQGVRDK